MTLSLQEVQTKLSKSSGYNLQIVLNENRSSILTVSNKRGRSAKLSLHRMFLTAPNDVLEAVAHFVKNKEHPSFGLVKAYIQSNLQRLDYSHKLDTRRLSTQGRYYNLQALFDEVNQEYFAGSVKLWLTWFEAPVKKNPSTLVYGKYFEPLKLIKINKLLDDEKVPKFFLTFVIYHEILHHVIPPYLNQEGVQCIHSKEFKAKEMEFKALGQAKEWELHFRRNYFSQFN